MNSEIKAKWLEDLRSGNFGKGIGKLHRQKFISNGQADEHTFCCLGVLCEQAVAEGVVERKFVEHINGPGGHYEYFDPNNDIDSSDVFPPAVVIEWAGLPSDNPAVELDPIADEDIVETEGRSVNLANLNDEWRDSFEPIADKIEQL
jgi:hypothetical protein